MSWSAGAEKVVGHEVQQPCGNVAMALYGHPLPGAFCEKLCADKLRSIGFEPVRDWGGSAFTHRDFRMVLSTYAGDWKTVGPEANMKNAWFLVLGGIAMGERTPLGKYLGSGHEIIELVPQVPESLGHPPLLSSQSCTTNSGAGGGG